MGAEETISVGHTRSHSSDTGALRVMKHATAHGACSIGNGHTLALFCWSQREVKKSGIRGI